MSEYLLRVPVAWAVGAPKVDVQGSRSHLLRGGSHRDVWRTIIAISTTARVKAVYAFYAQVYYTHKKAITTKRERLLRRTKRRITKFSLLINWCYALAGSSLKIVLSYL